MSDETKQEEIQVKRLKKEDRKEREKKIKKMVFSLLEDHKGRKFTRDEIAKEKNLSVELWRHWKLKEKRNVASIAEDARILSRVLKELVTERRIKKSEEADVYWIE